MKKEPCEHRKVDMYYDMETKKPVLWACRFCMLQFVPVNPQGDQDEEEQRHPRLLRRPVAKTAA
jgi:hypothetical protein